MIRFSYTINDPQIYKDIPLLKRFFDVETKFINDSVLLIKYNKNKHKDLVLYVLELGYDIIEES